MYLLDSDILIDHLRGYRSIEETAQLIGCRIEDFRISLITVVELYAGQYGLSNVETLIRHLPISMISLDIAKHAGVIRRAGSIKIGDAIIAATALRENVTVVTRNTRHFSLVPELKLFPLS